MSVVHFQFFCWNGNPNLKKRIRNNVRGAEVRRIEREWMPSQPESEDCVWILLDFEKQTGHAVWFPSVCGGQAGKLPLVGGDRHPPAFDLAQLGIRHVYLQGKLGHPDGEQQLSWQVEVGEVHCQGLPAAHFLTIHQHLVTVWGNLKGQEQMGNKFVTPFASH